MPDEAMPSDRPTVSAVITTHNRPEFLGEAIASALNQSYPMHEVIVIDDASSVSLDEVFSPFASKIVVERLEQNSGANRARNRGIELATGELVAFLDDDDIWHEDKVAKQVRALIPEAEACLCGYQETGNGRRNVFDIAHVPEDILRQGNPICGTSGLLARREVMLAIGFDPSLRVGQDWDVFIRLSMRKPLAYVAAPLYWFRRGTHVGITNANARRSPAELEDMASVVRKHREWLGETNYRRRLAATLLMYIGQRNNKLRFIAHALKKAGPRAVFGHLLQKITGDPFRRLRN